MTRPNLNRLLTLEMPQDVADGTGGYDRFWIPMGEHWAQVTPRTGRESTRGEAPTALVPAYIVVRASAVGSASRPQPYQRFRDATRVYRILSVTERDAKGQYLVCETEEEVVT